MAIPRKPKLTSLPNVKATLFFEVGKFGWTETYYSSLTDVATVLPIARSLAIQRSQLLTEDVFITAVRVSKDNVKRDSLVTFPARGDQKFKKAEGPTEIPHVCALVRIEGGDKYRRSLFLRGLGDTDIDGLNFEPNGAWADAFFLFASKLLKDEWGMKVADKDVVQPAPPAPAIAKFQNFTNVRLRKLGRRDTGRPFDLFRGRAPKRKSV